MGLPHPPGGLIKAAATLTDLGNGETGLERWPELCQGRAGLGWGPVCPRCPVVPTLFLPEADHGSSLWRSWLLFCSSICARRQLCKGSHCPAPWPVAEVQARGIPLLSTGRSRDPHPRSHSTIEAGLEPGHSKPCLLPLTP